MKKCPRCKNNDFESWQIRCSRCDEALVDAETNEVPIKNYKYLGGKYNPSNSSHKNTPILTRECPKCGKKYDDSWGVCLLCQEKLEGGDEAKTPQKIDTSDFDTIIWILSHIFYFVMGVLLIYIAFGFVFDVIFGEMTVSEFVNTRPNEIANFFKGLTYRLGN